MKYYLPIIFVVCCLVASCGQPGSEQRSSAPALHADSISYAQGFTIRAYEGYIAVDVRDPWDSTRLLQRYLLVDKGRPVPKGLPRGTLIRTPIDHVVVYSSIHASIIDELGEAGRIIGVCEPQYIVSPAIQERLRAGQIADLGMATSPNIEKMMDIGTEYIIASPFQNGTYGQVEKTGIPIIEGADYMESLPLGRAEWGKLYGLLFNRQQEADSIFQATEARYLALKELAAKAPDRPTIFSEKMYGSFWYIPGNDSYIARFFEDAGGRHVFQDTPGTGSVPLTFETVLDKAIHADIWLMKYNLEEELTYNGLRQEYTPYENFDAFKKRQVYTCNTGKVPYYEEFPIHPDYLLEDLIRIFHPELLPKGPLRYYRRME